MKTPSYIIVKFIIVCVLLMSCKAQEKNRLINTKLENIEKFNIKEIKNKFKLNEDISHLALVCNECLLN